MNIEENIKSIIRENADSDEIAEELFELIDSALESQAELDRSIERMKEEVLSGD